MSLQKLFQDKKALEVFEKAALSEGYNVFTKRGQFYCLSDLNVFATGYLYGMKVAAQEAPITQAVMHQDFYETVVMTEAEMYSGKSETKAA